MKHVGNKGEKSVQLGQEPIYENLIGKALDAVNDLKKDVKKMNKIICKIEEKVYKKSSYGHRK